MKTLTRTQQINRASRQDCSGSQWRKRMDEWLDTTQVIRYRIVWSKKWARLRDISLLDKILHPKKT